MLIDIVKIGNSRGIRLPKEIIKQCNIESRINLEVKNKTIIIKPLKNKTRSGWNAEFKKMKKNSDDRLIVNDNIVIEEEDWEW
ncbi:MAG: AbrB/MazE/SpoVT family DNA-binding domain-containing protein [Spirochaetes bacterium]|nr:AbrB/MazE/SpoVT family DNA-binding domain-containing protein [Spirochaetota bacterium]